VYFWGLSLKVQVCSHPEAGPPGSRRSLLGSTVQGSAVWDSSFEVQNYVQYVSIRRLAHLEANGARVVRDLGLRHPAPSMGDSATLLRFSTLAPGLSST